MNLTALKFLLLSCCAFSAAHATDVPAERMQAIYDAVKTPYKYGVVVPRSEGRNVDCPTVFRHEGRWYMVYVLFEDDPKGYTTQLATSDDLLHWKPLGTILQRDPNTWDRANVGGGIALIDTEWGGPMNLETYDGRYWMSYIGGELYGYEKTPLAIGMAWTRDPAAAVPWTRSDKPILSVSDPDVRSFESGTLYKSFIFRDPAASLGAPFVMYYNARPSRGDETIGMAISQNMVTWKRYGDAAVIVNSAPPGASYGVISGDPQIVRMGDLWVMFYFGAFWKSGAFDTFAASTDLVHWTKWQGPDLIKPSEPWDKQFAHKPWLIKHDGVVYHFYCAVGEEGRVIALATSKPMKEVAP